MDVQLLKMRSAGVEIDRLVLSQAISQRGTLVVLEVTDQGLRRLSKVMACPGRGGARRNIGRSPALDERKKDEVDGIRAR